MHGSSKNARKELARQMGEFLRLYRRKAQKGVEPNDRRYDGGIAQYIRRLKPEDLDVLLNGEKDERLIR
ncbi:MAG: hypothetical protein ABSH47_21200 [Bryobacteraceae bacterium]|jgi:hypothetical protein